MKNLLKSFSSRSPNALLSSSLRKRRLTQIRPYLRGRILDLGCGDGSLITFLPPHHSYVGVDRPKTVKVLRRRYPLHDFFAADLDDGLAIPSWYTFDTVVLCAVIEHLQSPGIILDQIGPVLAEDGDLIVTTPTPPGERLHHLGVVLGLFSHFAGLEHVRIYTREELESLLHEHGLALRQYQTFEFGLNQLVVASPFHARVKRKV